MRKYRLKKDTPTIKAGTIFQEVTSDYDKSRELVRIMPLGGTTSPQWTIDDINNFDKWFEEVKEFREFVPRGSEQYKCINEDGVVVSYYSEEDEVDSFNFSIGNCYPLDTPDEVIIKEQKLIPQAMHRLKMIAKKAWFEFNGSEGLDWMDDKQYKFYIYCSHHNGKTSFHTTCATSAQVQGCIYFPTEKSCQTCIDNNQDDLKLLFGVE